MAGYGYGYRGYSVYNVQQGEDWRSATSDAEGRRRPIISYNPSQNLASDYRYGTQIASVPVEDYDAKDDDRTGRKEAWWKTDRPKPVDEFLTQVQTEASRPRFGPLNASYWRQLPPYEGSQGATGGYSDYRDTSNTGWQNPNGNAYRNEKYDTYYQKNGSTMDPYYQKNGSTMDPYYQKNGSTTDPTMIASAGYTRPRQSPWATPTDASLSRPTSDISTAMAFLQEAAKPAAAARYDPVYTETIDSKEAARRYNKLNFGPRPYDAQDKYTPAIDSREAARKYYGTTV